MSAGIALAVSSLTPAARACEFTIATLKIVHPWTRATGPDATSAVLCMRFDEVSSADRLISVETPVATGWEVVGAATGGGLTIPVGQDTVLSEEGPHIRLTGLKHPLLIARTYPLNLTFEKGGIALAQLSVDYLPDLKNLLMKSAV